MPLSLRSALAVLGLLAGAATAVAVVAVHGRPWGLLLGLAATVATTLVLPRGWWSRLAFVLGWAAVVGYASVTRPEGDYLIAANVAGYTLLAMAFGLIVLGVATLPRPHGAAEVPGSPKVGT